MSKWIRNRKRTDGCPEKLIGKRVEVRLRDGSIHQGEADEYNTIWSTKEGYKEDILAYRIIEDEPAVAEKTPYQQHCEKYGVAEDVEWEIDSIYAHMFESNIATLHKDDGSTLPWVKTGEQISSCHLGWMTPYKYPAKIAPKLWAAYKDVLNDEALAALRDVICNQWDELNGGMGDKARDSDDINIAFRWAETTKDHDFWYRVANGAYNKPTTAIELQDAEIGIPEPMNEVIGASVAGHIHRVSDEGNVTMPVGPSIEELVAGGFLPALKPSDMVNHPPHYTQGGIECIDAIKAALTDEEYRGYCKGNALKYIWREKHKGGNESLQKANWYLDRIAK